MPGKLLITILEFHQEIKEEKQKEASPSFSPIELAKETDDYLKNTFQVFLWSQLNYWLQNFMKDIGLKYRDKKITSIKIFQSVLYYYLLKIMPNSNNVQDMQLGYTYQK
ncbi:MAG: hypothetical protein MZV63_57230 [Marinilabiliales bacterium]|nr:hypothetical protein [Marinilabiliales bacterium]